MLWVAIILGAILGVVGILSLFGVLSKDKEVRRVCAWTSGITLVIAIVCFAFASVTIIPPGHVGVKVLFGKVKSDVFTEGLHLKSPFISVKKMTTQTQSYTMTGKLGEGEVKEFDAIKGLTKDNLTVAMDITVLYKLYSFDAPKVYQILGFTDVYTEKIVRPAIRTAIRNSVARYNASEIMSEKRAEAEQDIQNELEKIFREYFTKQGIEHGIICERVMLRNVDPPQKLKDAIENKLKAEQDAQAMEFKLQQARKEAERKRIEAQGIKDAQEIINRSLTEKYLQWYYIETLKQLINSPNHSTIILPFDQKLTPMLQIPSRKDK